MKNLWEVPFIVVLIVLGIFFTAGLLCAQERPAFMVEDFKGIDVSGDSTNLDPSEALDIINLTPKFRGSLTVREGYSYLTSTSFGEPLTHINTYEPYTDSTRMVAVDSSGYVYVFGDMGDPGAILDTFKISILPIDGDSLFEIAIGGDDTLAVVSPAGNSWLRLYTQTGDVIRSFPDSNLLEITNMYFGLAGTDTLFAEDDFVSGGGRFTYEIFRNLTGEAYTRQFQDKLYICDSGGFTVVYDDTVWQFLAVVDSGIIDDTIATAAGLQSSALNMAHIDHGTNKVISDSDTSIWKPSNGVDVGKLFNYSFEMMTGEKGYYNSRKNGVFSSIITDIDSDNNILELSEPFLTDGWGLNYWNDYTVRELYFECGLGGQKVIIDSSKNWIDIVLGSQFLSSFYHTQNIRRFDDRDVISCNSEESFTFPTTTADSGHRYIIYPKFPWKFTQAPDDTAEVIQEAPRFSFVDFYLNQLYGIGFDRELGNDKDNVFRVWYSGISIPSYIVYNYNFDVDRTEKTTNLFSFGGNLYIATGNSIWRSTGFPILRETSSFIEYRGVTQSLIRLTQRIGMPDWDNYIEADENYSFFVNRQGVYRFTGSELDQISIRVDPIIEQNFDSEIVTVYLNKELYISFPDSNFTLVYNETYDLFYKIDFAFLAAFAPPDTNIMYFVHSEHPDRIYTYPNGEYWDRNSVTDSSEIEITYKSGWQSYGKWWLQKKPYWTYYDIDVSDTVIWKLFQGFSTVASDSFITDSTQLYGRYVYRDPHPSSVFEEYFQYQLTGSVDTIFTLMGYRAEWDESIRQNRK